MSNHIDDLVTKMESSPKSVRFLELEAVCKHYFGRPRKGGGSHRVYKTPWLGDSRVNIQNSHGKTNPEPLSSKKFSGKFVVRVPVELHRELVLEALENKISLNRYVSNKLAHHRNNH